MHTLLTTKDRTICVGGLFCLLLFVASAARAQNTPPKIKMVPPPKTSAASGAEMYNAYCASCHGKDGKGDGPAAPALKGPVPDLTTLAQRNGGKYPAAHVDAVIRFGAEAPVAHGTLTMPTWGPMFGAMHQSTNSPEVRLRISNLTQYLGTLQVK